MKVADPDDTIDAAMGMMIQAKIRYLPVVSDGPINGMLSIESRFNALAKDDRYAL